MTVNELIKTLENKVKDDPRLGDAIVIDIDAPSYNGLQNNMSPEEMLLKCVITATTTDGSIVYHIVAKAPRFI